MVKNLRGGWYHGLGGLPASPSRGSDKSLATMDFRAMREEDTGLGLKNRVGRAILRGMSSSGYTPKKKGSAYSPPTQAQIEALRKATDPY